MVRCTGEGKFLPIAHCLSPSLLRLLLAEAVKASQAPDNFGRIDAHHPSRRKTFLDDAQGPLVVFGTESRNDDGGIADVKISIRSRETLPIVYNGIRHRQLHNIQLPAIQQSHLPELR